MDRPACKPLPRIVQWTPPGRTLIFCLAATSIWSLLAEFYNLWSMRTFTFGVLVPATGAMVLIALLDRSSGDGRLWKSVVIGATGGLLAAVAYDVFRLPWVVCAATHAGPGWLRLPLFKVFPRF